MSQFSEQAVGDFIERLGLVAQADGLPRIAGRIMGLMVIYGGPLSFKELSEKLKVSRGSISTNTRLLEALGVVERISKIGHRQDFFQIRTKPYIELQRGSLTRLYRAKEVVDNAQADIPNEWQETQLRLEELGNFYKSMIENTEKIIAESNS